MREMVGGCCVCSDDRGWSENPLVYCDGQSCTVAVHQACYGIVSVPTGPWYCRKCESQERAAKVKCELCPSRYGALKRTDNAGWAHVVCALYIPEVRFGNVTTMEPIQLQLIPPERFNKVCYICEEKGKPANASVGACMQCNRAGCKQQFHVTCAQSLGLLCEEAGNYLDNVKYCGYCQYHYSKLKKGGNVKTIPPYKPVSNENQLSDSSSEKDAEGIAKSATIPSSMSSTTTTSTSAPSNANSGSSSKRKSTLGSKTGSSSSSAGKSSSGSSGKSSSPNQNIKTTSSSHHKSSFDKTKVNNSGATSTSASSKTNAKSDDFDQSKDSKSNNDHHADVAENVAQTTQTLKESKGSKKRKAHSRTPTPVTIESNSNSSVSNVKSDKTEVSEAGGVIDKIKKVRVETTQSIISNQPIVALTSISTIKPAPPRLTTPPAPTPTSSVAAEVVTSTQTIIQSITSTSQSSLPPPLPAPVTSLVVSVPLSSTSLSPHPYLVGGNPSGGAGGNSVNVPSSVPSPLHEKNNSNNLTAGTGEELSNNLDSLNLDENARQNNESSNCGGLKITYEKQETANITEEDMELEEIQSEVAPVKRTRSQSNDKPEKPTGGRGKKRGSTLNGLQMNSSFGRGNPGNRSQHAIQTSQTRLDEMVVPAPVQPGAFAGIGQNQLKQSPPSSPSPESQQSLNVRMKPRGRKSAPASISNNSSRDSKDMKFFHNGVSAPHMLGNQLNPNSNMAQKMSDHLNSELEAHSIFNPSENANMMGPQLHHKVIATARSSSAGSTASANSGLSGMLGGSSGNIPQTLDQLLERQWEQGSQFLMEQAQHFDIASLLSCLHQLRAENLRLEEHVSSLLQRRDHLLAVNARLAIPLTGQPATPQSSHPHAVNNIHPAVGGGHGDIPRSRHSTGSSGFPSHLQGSTADVPMENGLPSDPNQLYPGHHRSPAPGQPQRSPTMRLSPATTSYTNSTLVRPGADASGRSAPRPQPYSHYQGPGTSAQQMVIRRENEVYAQSSKPPS